MSPTCAQCGTTNAGGARFCQACGHPTQPGVARSQQSRKTVTIVFSDLVDSTALGESLDAETLLAVLDRYFDAVRAVIERHGGVVEKFIGDAVMAVFGIPRTHEDDALRAVRSAVEMRATVARLNHEFGLEHGVRLASRTGVNTGVVVVGDGADGQRLATGDAVNVAARLEQAAEAGGIVLGPATFRLVRDAVAAEPIGPLVLKGKSDPMNAYQLVDLSLDGDLPNVGLTSPLVGRRSELELIGSRLEAATAAGAVSTVVITGEPGVGKTRLLRAAIDALEGTATVLTAGCRPYGETSFWPISQLLSAAVGDEKPLDVEALRDLAARGSIDDREATVDRVASLVGLSSTAYPLTECFWATARLVGSLANARPLVLVVEDLHWGEDTLLDLVDHLRMSGQAAGTLILVTARPELLVRRWSGDRQWRLDVVRLPALSGAESDALIDGALGSTQLPKPARALLSEAAGGNPLFLEQAMTDWIEDGVLVRGQHGWTVTRAVADVSVPATVRAIFEARLDRLSEGERSVLGAAAVAGPGVERAAIDSMLPDLGRDELDRRLDVLLASALLHAVGTGATNPDALAFTHASLREVAYAMTLKSDRADLHERFASWRETVDEESPADESVGHHLAEAHRYRSELRQLDPHNRDLAMRGARHLVAAGRQTISLGDRAAADRLLGQVVELLAASGPEVGSRNLPVIEETARLLLTTGRWPDAVSLLTPYEHLGHGPLLRDLGVALCQLHHDDRGSDEFREGQRLLELASRADESDTDALASLAGTWKGTDDARAHALYRRCLTADPGDPYALGNVLEYELAASGDLSVLDDFGDQIDGAIRRCRSQCDAGLRLPWAFFDSGKFLLLSGQADRAMASYARAAYLATADHMLVTSMESLRRIEDAAGELEGAASARMLLSLARAVRFPSQSSLAPLGAAAPLAGVDNQTSIVLLAGGTEATANEWVSRHAAQVGEAFSGFEGVIISGGTDGGVPALAGAVGSRHGPSIRTIGYLPSQLPDGTAADSRYHELRRSPDRHFSIAQSLEMWADLLASGVRPASVRLLAINGGLIAGSEFRVALALGCAVGAVVGSGRATDRLVEDPDWVAAPNLTRVSMDVESIARFLSTDP